MSLLWLLVFVGIIFGLGVLLGHTLFGDGNAERGEYVFGDDHKPSGWRHGDALYLPEWYAEKKREAAV